MPNLNRPARPSDPALQDLYSRRRKAAKKAMGYGLSSSNGWMELEIVESQLRRLDPDGEWRREYRSLETGKWMVKVDDGYLQ